MKSVFVYTGQEYIPLERIEKILPVEGRGWALSGTDGKLLDGNNQSIGDVAVHILPAQGEWECLTAYPEEDGGFAMAIEPVIAFAVNVFGFVGPVTPSQRGGLFEEFALKKSDSSRVYDCDGRQYANPDEWFENRYE